MTDQKDNWNHSRNHRQEYSLPLGIECLTQHLCYNLQKQDPPAKSIMIMLCSIEIA